MKKASLFLLILFNVLLSVAQGIIIISKGDSCIYIDQKEIFVRYFITNELKKEIILSEKGFGTYCFIRNNSNDIIISNYISIERKKSLREKQKKYIVLKSGQSIIVEKTIKLPDELKFEVSKKYFLHSMYFYPHFYRNGVGERISMENLLYIKPFSFYVCL